MAILRRPCSTLRCAAERGTRITSIRIGAFALAARGLLDGRSAPTHWQEVEQFRTRFPSVRIDADVLYVDEGQLLTSAGLSAGTDLCLYLVGLDCGAAAGGPADGGGHAPARRAGPLHRRPTAARGVQGRDGLS